MLNCKYLVFINAANKIVLRDINDITYAIRGAAFKVHTALGPRLLESAYEACMEYELLKQGLMVERQKPMPVNYEGVNLEVGYRIDLLVEDCVIVELKSIKQLTDVDTAQILTYMRLANISLGLLMNFSVVHMRDGIKRYRL
ncbi:MAG: GxxExxY protein [Lewinella sp.]